jgi:hypothetical protein
MQLEEWQKVAFSLEREREGVDKERLRGQKDRRGENE